MNWGLMFEGRYDAPKDLLPVTNKTEKIKVRTLSCAGGKPGPGNSFLLTATGNWELVVGLLGYLVI